LPGVNSLVEQTVLGDFELGPTRSKGWETLSQEVRRYLSWEEPFRTVYRKLRTNTRDISLGNIKTSCKSSGKKSRKHFSASCSKTRISSPLHRSATVLILSAVFSKHGIRKLIFAPETLFYGFLQPFLVYCLFSKNLNGDEWIG
jgi:hypothetical protein